MLQTLRSMGFNQFEFARWAEKEHERYKIIRVEPVSDRERQFNSVIQNLVTTADSKLIRTAFAYDYKPRQHMFYRNKWWEILSVGMDDTAVNPQALGLVNVGAVQYIIELGEIVDYDE